MQSDWAMVTRKCRAPRLPIILSDHVAYAIINWCDPEYFDVRAIVYDQGRYWFAPGHAGSEGTLHRDTSFKTLCTARVIDEIPFDRALIACPDWIK